MAICQRKSNEDELTFLRRKEIAFGLWQGDMIERMRDDDLLIKNLTAENEKLKTAVQSLNVAAQCCAEFAQNILNAVEPMDFAKDFAPFINIMAHHYKVEPYAKPKRTRK